MTRSLLRMTIGLNISHSFHDRTWKPLAPTQPRMGRQSAKNPVVIDLIDSDSDVEIIHHAIVILDDETPPKPGSSRPTTQQVG